MIAPSITPITLETILNAAFFEITKHPNDYSQYTKDKLEECIKWLLSIDWEYPGCEDIVIDKKPII